MHGQCEQNEEGARRVPGAGGNRRSPSWGESVCRCHADREGGEGNRKVRGKVTMAREGRWERETVAA